MHPSNKRNIDSGNHKVPLDLKPGPLVQPNRGVARLPRLQVDRLRQRGGPLHVVEDGVDQPEPEALALERNREI